MLWAVGQVMMHYGPGRETRRQINQPGWRQGQYNSRNQILAEMNGRKLDRWPHNPGDIAQQDAVRGKSKTVVRDQKKAN